jgi:hypothetical protein
MEDSETPQQDNHGKGTDQRRQNGIAQWVINLRPDFHRSSLLELLCGKYAQRDVSRNRWWQAHPDLGCRLSSFEKPENRRQPGTMQASLHPKDQNSLWSESIIRKEERMSRKIHPKIRAVSSSKAEH